MAQKSLAWKELRVGILVVASFVLLAVAIIFIGGDSGFFTPKYHINAYFGSASGLHEGAAVLLDGVTIGNVAKVRLSADAEPKQAVQASLRIERKYQNMIRTNAIVAIGTVGLLGDQQVELTRGTADKPAIQDGGTIQGIESGDIKRIITGTSDVVANLNDLTDQVGEVIKKVNKGEGTLGLVLNDRSVYDKLNATVGEMNSLVKDARGGNGTIGRLMSDDELYRSFKSTVDRLDSSLNKVDGLIAKIDRGDGTLGRFINNPSIYDKTDQAMTRLGIITEKIERGEGTLGKLSKDDALYNNMNATLNKSTALLTSVENGEGTLGKLMKDTTLYNSLTQTSSELQKLMYDFRQNPKKYLTINFRLF